MLRTLLALICCLAAQTPSQSFGAVAVRFSSSFPERSKAAVVEIVNKVEQSIGNLQMPPSIEFNNEPVEGFEVAYSDMSQNKVALMSEVFRLSGRSFTAAVSHEIGHLIVGENFKSRMNRQLKLREDLDANRTNVENLTVISEPLLTLAEVLSDTLGVIVTGDPRVYPRMINELIEIRSNLANIFDLGALGKRDFTVSPTDRRWRRYFPDSFYTLGNQLRGYIWNRKLKNLPHQQRANMFSRFFRALEPIYHSSSYNQTYEARGAFEANQEVIEYLEQELAN